VADSDEPSAWETQAPVFRLPAGLKLPDLSGSLDELEARLAGRALAAVGGLAVILGAIFFLGLAFSRGWIGPELRVVIGLAAGSLFLGGGAVFMERGNRLLGHVLTPVGLAVITVSVVASTRLYELAPIEIGVGVALLSSLIAAAIAVRANSQLVAAFGLVSVLVSPPLIGASPDLVMLAFIAVVLVATTAVALWRSWSWLPPAAFVLSAPQASVWFLGDPEPGIGLAGIGFFWLVNVVAAGGEEFRRHRDDLSPSSVTLLLANVAFAVWAGFELLTGDLLVNRGFFLLLVAVAQLGIGGFFVLRDGERNLFGLVAMGTGIAALTMAAPIQLGASAVPVAWAAEAVVLAWVAVRRGHPYSAFVSAILYILAAIDLVMLYRGPIESTSGIPFVDGPGASLVFFLGALTIGVWIVRDKGLRSVLATLGLVVAALNASVVLDQPGSAVAVSALMVVGVAVWRLIPTLPNAPIEWLVEGLIAEEFRDVGDWRRLAGALLPAASVLLGVSATLRFLGPIYGSSLGDVAIGVPFADPAGAALLVFLGSLAVVAWLARDGRLRHPLAAVGLLVVTWASISEFDDVALVAAWSVLAVVGLAIRRGLAALTQESPIRLLQRGSRTVTLDTFLPIVAGLGGLLAVLHVIVSELPIFRFGSVRPPEIPFTDDGAVAALILIVAAVAGGVVVGGSTARRVSVVAVGGVAAHAIPYEVYAWAVAVLWAGLAGISLALPRLDRPGRSVFLVSAGLLVAGAATVAAGIQAPPSRLIVQGAAIDPVVGLQSAAAFGAVALALVALSRIGRPAPWVRWTWIAFGVTIVYGLSVAVVDTIATQVGGSIATDELRTQGQVALSVLWAVLGVVVFVAGLRFAFRDLRHAGLVLLGVATAKVFLFDLSALDVSYRVISLIVVGLILLASAGLWQRLQPRLPAAEEPSPTPPGATTVGEPAKRRRPVARHRHV